MKIQKRLCKYLRVTANHLHTSMEHTHDVELLNKIQYLMEGLALSWYDGRPVWDEGNIDVPCGCAHAQAKRDLLAVLMTEYDRRTYKPEDTRRMHLSE